MSIPTGQGKLPSAQQQADGQAEAEHWRKVGREAPVQALARAEDAAKQLVALTGMLQGLYVAVFALSDLRARLGGGFLPLAFLLPLALWAASLYCATRVFIPQARDADLSNAGPRAWEQLRTAHDQAGRDKLAWLHRAHALLVASFGALLVLLVVWMAIVPPAPEAGPTRVILITPTPQLAAPTP